MSIAVAGVEIPNSLINVPNATSGLGFALVHDGLKRGSTTPLGITEIGVGRVLDLADGKLARLLGQSSKFGALLDASLDKKATLMIMNDVVEKELIPQPLEDAIKMQNMANVALTAVAKVVDPKRELSPSVSGKHSMFGQGLMMGSYLLAETIKDKHPNKAKAVRLAGHVIGVTALFYKGTKATSGYFDRIWE